MNYSRKPVIIEIGIIFLFLIFSTFIIFIGESHFDAFKKSSTINEDTFFTLIFWSFVKALIIDMGFVFFYYFNKSRIKKGKN